VQARAEEKVESEPGVLGADIMNLEKHVANAAQARGRVEPQLQATLNLIPAHTWFANASGALTFLNERGCDYLGLPKDHPLRLGIGTGAEWDSHIPLLHPDDYEESRRVWSTCLRTGSAGQTSFRVRNAEGGYRWFLSRAEPVRASDGTLLYWIGVNLDIEDRKQAELYLAEGQRLAHMGSWTFNATGFDYWSSELFRIYGLDPGGKAPTVEEYMAFVHPEDREFVAETIRKMFAEGRGFDFTKRIVRPDGKIRSVRCVGVPSTHGGTSQGFVGTGIDVTEQERILDELKRSEFYLSEGQRLGHVGSWSINPSGFFDYWSRELFQIYGLDPKRKAPTIEEYLASVHPQDREFMARMIERMLAKGLGCDVKKRIVRPDGKVRYVRCVGIPIVENGFLKRIVGTAMDITEQEELTQELGRREAYLAEAQRLSHTGSFGWKPDTGELIWSAETYRIFEYDQAVRPTIDLVVQRAHPEDRADVQSVIERASRGASDFEHTYRLLLPGGRVKHVHALAHVTQDAFGNREFVGAVTDITEQRRAEESLRESESYLAEAQKLSHTGSWAWSPDTDVRYWSEECYRVLGFDPRDGLPRFEEFIKRIHPDDQPAFRESAKRAAHNKLDEEVDYRIVHPGGAVRDIHSVGHPVFSPCGDLVEFVGTVIDITERKRAEEELRRREAYLAEAQRLSHTGSFGWKYGAMDELIWSEETYRICGFNSSIKPTHEMVRDRVHPEDLQVWQQALDRAAEGKEVDFENRLVMPDGTVKFLHTVAYGVRKDGKFVELVGTVRDITEQKAAEKAVRRSEAYLAEAQRLSHTGSSAHDPATGKIHYWSEETYRIWGLEPQQPPPDKSMMLKMIHPEDRDLVYEQYLNAVREGKDYDQKCRIVQSGGAVRHIHVVGHPVFSAGGELIDYVSTHMDITERKRAEDELRASERKYRNLVDTTPALVHTALPNGDLDFFNRGWLEYLGLSITDLLGWRWTALIHPEDVEEMLNKWRASLESGQPFVAESRVRRADEEYRWFLHRKQPQRNEAGEIVKWYGSSIEIEERKIAEEATRRGEAFLAEGQRLSHTGSWGWNASTGKLTWSQEHFRILGLDSQTTNPSLDMFWERVHPDDRIGLRRTFESAIRDKRDFEQEFRIVTPDWSIRHLHGVGHAVLNKANELVEFIGSTMDITERKRAEARAQSHREAIQLALNAFVEKLDVNRFLGDIIAELNKQLHAKSWELWLFDEAISALLLHSSSHPTEHFNPEFGNKNARPLEELQGLWRIKDAARAPQILELSSQESLLSRRHAESLTRRGIKTLMIAPLVLGEQNLGFLELHFQSQTQFSSDDLELAQALVNRAALALQLNRLTRRAEELAVTEERNRLAREIHDTLAQAFAGVVLHSEVLGASLAVSKRRSAKALSQIQKLARSGLEEARRSVQALRPKALDGTALPEALEQAALRLCEDAKLSCQFRQRGKKMHLSGETQNALFRIAQEALANVVKHAQAKSVCITLESQAGRVRLSIKDDGIGLATAKRPDQSHGFGMGTMRERAQGIGGRFRVESRPGRGTTIRVEVPSAVNRSKKKVNQ